MPYLPCGWCLCETAWQGVTLSSVKPAFFWSVHARLNAILTKTKVVGKNPRELVKDIQRLWMIMNDRMIILSFLYSQVKTVLIEEVGWSCMILGEEKNFYDGWWSKAVMENEHYWWMQTISYKHHLPGQSDDALVVTTPQSRILEDKKKHAATVPQADLAHRQTWNKSFYLIFQYENIPFPSSLIFLLCK